MTGLKSNLQLGPIIGHGHFGEVLLAHDDIHGDVAVKILRQRPAESQVDWKLRRDGLLKEGQQLREAAHPNVVKVHYLVEAETNDAVHLVMEYCQGGSLQSVFERGPMSLADVLKASTEVAMGLQALHLKGMLHRDIKPGNLLQDGNGTTKLGDFGLVTDNLLLGYGSQAGYTDHIAYEVWKASGTSVRSDIWALGATMFRLLHGAEWYSRSPAPRYIIANGGFADSLNWLPHIPARWRRVIRKMLHDDPKSRYQHVGQVISALATLDVEPRWTCKVTSSKVSWQRRGGGRRVRVSWTRLSQRRYEWAAWSEPLGKGRTRHLGASSAKMGYDKSAKELSAFFASQHRT